MTLADWLFVVLPLLFVAAVAVFTRHHMRGVSDFLAAGRSAGRYLICNAEGTAAMGAVTIVAAFEQLYQGGPAVGWWSTIAVPVWLMVTLTGFLIYRYRETRVLTLAEFFERRYSKRFRVFMGALAFLSGVIHYGIFPAVGARFIVHFCGMPGTLDLAGLPIPTFAPVMAAILSANVTLATMGGQLTAMITDCIEGILSNVFFLIISVAMVALVGLHRIRESFAARPPGSSFLDPFDTFAIQDFNIWFVLIGILTGIYGYMAWQSNQGFNASALNPHEARMGRILGQWRGYARGVMIFLLGMCAYTLMHHADFAALSDGVRAAVDEIAGGDMVRKQMTVPVTLGHAMPAGVKGMFLATMIFSILAADTSAIHSWGSIFVQDVLLPFRKNRLTPAAHIRLLRWSIAGVAVFAFFFSLLFRQTEYILMYFAVTGAIFLGGAGAVIIGGLYWSRGTTPAAWAAMIVGSAFSAGSIVLRQVNPAFPLNGQVLGFLAMLAAIAVYVGVSLATCRRPFEMARLLHRGTHAVDADGAALPVVPGPPRTWQTLLGIDDQFTRGDRFQSVFLFFWSMAWFALFLGMLVWNLFSRWPLDWWWNYLFIAGIALPMVLSVITTVWFGWGGLRDLRRLFRRLGEIRRDARDDGELPETDRR